LDSESQLDEPESDAISGLEEVVPEAVSVATELDEATTSDDDFVLNLDQIPEVETTQSEAASTTRTAVPVPARYTPPVYSPPPPAKPAFPTAPMPRPKPPTQKASEPESDGVIQKYGKIALISGVVLAAAIFGIAYLFSNDPPPTFPPVTVKASKSLTAEEYYQAFARDNAQAGLNYDEMTIELTGKVKKVEGSTNVVYLETSSTRCIECQFGPRDSTASIKVGDQIVIVGEGKARKKPATDTIELLKCRLKE
jgi:hypothetical protein